jgi:glucokinase
LRHAAFVAIGTGIGVGVLADGAVLRGARGIAGAAGWFALDGDWNEAYRVVGAWEAVSAGPAIARAYGVGEARVVVEAARAGDAKARAVLDRAARHTGKGVANLISLLDPDAVILGGGVIQGAGDLLLDTIRSEALRWAQPIAAARCRIEISRLGEDAGLLGAARLAFTLA